MLYFDSGYIAKCYLRERGTDEVLNLAENSAGRTSLVLAALEVQAVFHRHFREKRLDAAAFRSVNRRFDKDQKDGYWRWLPMSDELVRRAAVRFQNLPQNMFLRSADCLHLCAAIEAGFTEVHSNDRQMIAAAPFFGLLAVDVISPRG